VAAFLSAVTVGTPEAFSKVAGLTTAIENVGIAAYKVVSSHAYQTVFYSTIAFSTLGLICSLFAPNVDELMTDKVVATLHKHEDEEMGEKWFWLLWMAWVDMVMDIDGMGIQIWKQGIIFEVFSF
jgi:hypothetical protein